MPTRILLTFALAATAFLAVASTGHAAPAPPRWCGTDEATADRLPDAVASYQLHAVYAIPSDGTDRYFQDAPLIARDLAAIDSWWISQDSTRTLRWDMQAFAGCDSLFGGLDISFIRLPAPASAYADPVNGGYSNLVRGLSSSFLDPYKKYEVFYDGPIDPNAAICGVSSFGPIDIGASYAFTLVQADAAEGRCGSLGNSDYMAETSVHEVIHNLGAVSPSAPHVCANGHVCDSLERRHVAVRFVQLALRLHARRRPRRLLRPLGVVVGRPGLRMARPPERPAVPAHRHDHRQGDSDEQSARHRLPSHLLDPVGPRDGGVAQPRGGRRRSIRRLDRRLLGGQL